VATPRARTTCCCEVRTSTCRDQTLRHPFFSALDPQFRYDFPNGGDSLAPQAFVKDITAPVLISGAWQDEQTGGRSADLLNRFAPTTKVRAVFQNGVHTESLDPSVHRGAHRVPGLLRRAEGPDDPADGALPRTRDLAVDHRRRGTHAARGPLQPGDGLRDGQGAVRVRSEDPHQLGGRERDRFDSRRAGSERADRGTRRGRSPRCARRRGTSSPVASSAPTRSAAARPIDPTATVSDPGRATPHERRRVDRQHLGREPDVRLEARRHGKSLAYISAPLTKTVSMAGTAASTSG